MDLLPLFWNGYSIVVVDAPKYPFPLNFEMIDDEMARIIRAKTGAERLQIASQMYASARRMLLSHLQHEHPDWDNDRVQREAARRLSHGKFSSNAQRIMACLKTIQRR